jgi:hypothetical protein
LLLINNQQEMMSMRRDMIKDCGMDISMMMGMMNQK